ncbi:MAG: maleylpyruvate isomerase N-terminal domain-containing protein [Actinomycetota bacterium]
MSTVTTSPLLSAVDKTAHRVSLLMRAANHPEKKAIGFWTVGETANHLAHCYVSFVDAFRGMIDVAPEDIDAHNAEILAEDPERDLDVLADRVDRDAPEYLEAAGSVPQDTLVDFFTGMRVPASAVSATLLGEALVHGYDIAKAEGLPWPIEPEHAILVMEKLAPVMVHFVDEDTAADLEAGFEIRLRGGSTQYWYFEDGKLTIEYTQVEPVDCHISADPVTYLLMSYNRIGSTMPSLTGKVRVWGRRPWLAMRLGGVFRT